MRRKRWPRRDAQAPAGPKAEVTARAVRRATIQNIMRLLASADISELGLRMDFGADIANVPPDDVALFKAHLDHHAAQRRAALELTRCLTDRTDGTAAEAALRAVEQAEAKVRAILAAHDAAPTAGPLQ